MRIRPRWFVSIVWVTFLFLIITHLICKSSFSAEIYEGTMYSTNHDCLNIVIEGTIKKGDYNKFQNTVKRITDSNNCVTMVQLDSNGGDVLEAMKIGRLIRKLLVSTSAPLTLGDDVLCPNLIGKKKNASDACVCYSSCFFIWAGGVIRTGNSISVHRPRFSKEYFKGLSAKEAKKKYRVLSNGVKNYLIDMDIPIQVIEEMFQYSSNEVKTLNSDTITTMDWAPFYQEWIIANCGRSLSDEEWTNFNELNEKMREQGLTKDEQFYRKYLVNKANNRSKCEINKKREIQYKAMK